MEVTRTEAKEILDGILINELGGDLTQIELEDLSDKILNRLQDEFELFEEEVEEGDENEDLAPWIED